MKLPEVPGYDVTEMLYADGDLIEYRARPRGVALDVTVIALPWSPDAADIVKALAKADHAHLERVFDLVLPASRAAGAFLVCERRSGARFSDLMRGAMRMRLEVACRIVRDAARGAAVLDRLGVALARLSTRDVFIQDNDNGPPEWTAKLLSTAAFASMPTRERKPLPALFGHLMAAITISSSTLPEFAGSWGELSTAAPRMQVGDLIGALHALAAKYEHAFATHIVDRHPED